MRQLVYDIEVFPNYFCACFVDFWTDEQWYFEISSWKDDRKEMINFIRGNWLLGYNNQDYDDVIINYIVLSKRTNKELYELSQFIIKDGSYNKIKKFKWNKCYTSVDIMRMMFSKALRVSLKELQVNIDWPRVQDLPLHFTTVIKREQVEDIKDYCFNDVFSTKAVAKKVADKIQLRIDIERKFGLKCLSKDDVNTGVSLFAKFYEEDTGDKSFLNRRTYRPSIALADCISDKVYFNSKPFSELLTILKNKVITKTKGALKHSVIYGGVKHVYGTGGIHSKDRPGTLKPEDDEIYMDADVSSLYPSLWIVLGICPEHLEREIFIPRYQWLRDTRLEAKKVKDMLIADTYKLSLNGSYGNLISEYSWLYDPKVAMSITLNGQLYLSMLSEWLTDAGFKVDSLNTDGITAFIKKSRLNEYYAVCKKWEEYTGLVLEYARYHSVYRRDVNTYFAVFADDEGKPSLDKNGNYVVKEKGDFVTNVKMGKGYDKPVIQKALKAYFIDNIPIETFIRNHNNIYDFCMMQKMGRSKNGNLFRALYEGELLQKTNRFYATSNRSRGYLYKIEEGITHKKDHVLQDSGVIIFNDYIEKPIHKYEINYEYYIREAEKVRRKIEPSQLALF